MNAETMMVDPNELVVDMPVDDSHIQELMDSLRKTGRMIEPVSVWLQGMRIINGFHRIEAAKRLGWTTLPALIQDCTEDEFWDARIIAAKPHYRIESARLAQWMMQSWMQTKWHTGGELYQSMLVQVWEVIAKPNATYPKREVKGESVEVLAWFEDKALRWGISVGEIADKLQGIPRHRTELAVELDLSLEQALMLEKTPQRGSHEEVRKWIEREVLASESPSPFRVWLASEDEAKRRLLEEKSRERQEQNERQRRFDSTPQGRAKLEQEERFSNQKHIRDNLNYAKAALEHIHDYMSIDGAPAMLAEFAQFVADFAAEHFPDVQVATPNPVALENSRLRAENSRLKERIASLERALGSKQAAGEMLSNAMAWSSGDMERQ